MSDLPPPKGASAGDPRERPGEGLALEGRLDALRPSVAPTANRGGLGLIIVGAAGLGLLTFAILSAQRHAPETAPLSAAGRTADIPPPPPAPPEIAMTEAEGRGATQPAPAPLPSQPPQTPTTAAFAPPPPPKPQAFALDVAALGRKAPSLVVDLGEAPPAGTGAAAAGAAPGAGAKAATSAADAASLNADEKFAERVSAAEPERSRATVIRNTKETIPQGVLIPGVLETALNSDLPGFTRAVISRDVRGFDGTTVLIPRGSRVIGQYKSAAAQGQSRALVVWTRIIRPDGASIQIASSGTDTLGRAGLEGKVDRHFFEQFSGAILLTVLDAGVTALANQPSTQVVIGSSGGIGGLGSAAVTATPIPPTIKVPQGSPIEIFVARDLDFTTVGPPR